MISFIEQQIAALDLYRSRINYAIKFPLSFSPTMLFDKFPELDASNFKAVVDWEPLDDRSV